MTATCTVEPCERMSESRGMCSMHYQRWNRNGKVELLSEWVNPFVCVCEVPNADPSVAWGMCQSCYRKPLALFGVKA